MKIHFSSHLLRSEAGASPPTLQEFQQHHTEDAIWAPQVPKAVLLLAYTWEDRGWAPTGLFVSCSFKLYETNRYLKKKTKNKHTQKETKSPFSWLCRSGNISHILSKSVKQIFALLKSYLDRTNFQLHSFVSRCWPWGIITGSCPAGGIIKTGILPKKYTIVWNRGSQ